MSQRPPGEFGITAFFRNKTLSFRQISIERGILISLLVAAAGLWIFAEIAEEVLEGETVRFDQFLYHFIHGDGTAGGIALSEKLQEAVRDLTALGSYTVLGLFSAAVCGYLLLSGHRRAAVFVLGAVLSGVAISLALKAGFDRPRPDPLTQQAKVFTESFPSGHSMLSAVVYLTLAALLARLHSNWREKIFLIGVAVLLALLVGLSRLSLGVHWPTDILSGWAIGAAWACLCWALFLFLQNRGVVESEGLTDPRQNGDST